MERSKQMTMDTTERKRENIITNYSTFLSPFRLLRIQRIFPLYFAYRRNIYTMSSFNFFTNFSFIICLEHRIKWRKNKNEKHFILVHSIRVRRIKDNFRCLCVCVSGQTEDQSARQRDSWRNTFCSSSEQFSTQKKIKEIFVSVSVASGTTAVGTSDK